MKNSNLKRTLMFFTLGSIVFLFILSCEKDEENKENNSIVGKWLSEKTIYNQTITEEIKQIETKVYDSYDIRLALIEFKKDLTYTVDYLNDTARKEFGKYSLNGINISIYSLSGEDSVNNFTYEVADSVLRIISTDPDDGDLTIKYFKRK